MSNFIMNGNSEFLRQSQTFAKLKKLCASNFPSESTPHDIGIFIMLAANTRRLYIEVIKNSFNALWHTGTLLIRVQHQLLRKKMV